MNQDLKSELYKIFAARYLAIYTCWECYATGLRLSNPKDSRYNDFALRTPCESCSGGYIHCEQDTAAGYAAAEFYKEWIACCVVERKYKNECAFKSPEQLLSEARYGPHFAYIIQYPRPAIYDAEEWVSYAATGTWEGQKYDSDPPEPVSYSDGAIEGMSLCHRWAEKDWSQDFIDETHFLKAAVREGVDVKAALSRQDAWGRTPFHFGLPPADSKLWEFIAPETLTAIPCMNSSERLSRFSAYRPYDRFEWTSIANGFDQRHSAIETYLYHTYGIIIYYNLVEGETEEEIRRNYKKWRGMWHDRVEHFCKLLKQERFVLDVGILTALFELDARSCEVQGRKKEYYADEEGDPIAQLRTKLDYKFSRFVASRNACLQIINSVSEQCFEVQLAATYRRIATADSLTYEDSGVFGKDSDQLRDLMKQGLDSIYKIYKVKQQIAASIDKIGERR